MKAQHQKLYQWLVAMYDHQDYFDNPVNCVNPPVPDPRYNIGAPCPRANLVSLDPKSIVSSLGSLIVRKSTQPADAAVLALSIL